MKRVRGGIEGDMGPPDHLAARPTACRANGPMSLVDLLGRLVSEGHSFGVKFMATSMSP